jgi:hypothetical protein
VTLGIVLLVSGRSLPWAGPPCRSTIGVGESHVVCLPLVLDDLGDPGDLVDLADLFVAMGEDRENEP